MNRCVFAAVIMCALVLSGCSKDNEEDVFKELTGTWVLTHVSFQHHYYQNGIWWDDNTETDVEAFEIIDISGFNVGKWWDYLSFYDNYATLGLIQNSLPTEPLGSQYDLDTPEGQIAYEEARYEWLTAIDCQSGDFPWMCPYQMNGNKLFLGSLYQGDVSFYNSDSFALVYTDTNFSTNGEYKKYIYSFRRNS